MNSKEIKVKLIGALERDFVKYGFIYDKKEGKYTRTVGSAKQTFYFLVNDRDSGIYIEPRWSIRLNEIVDIYHQITVKDKEFFDYTPVLENSLGQLIEYKDEKNERGSGKKMSYLVENKADIEILKKVIPLRFEEYVLPYFEMNSSVSRIDELLNRDPQELVIHQWLNPYRIIMAVIAAKLNNNPRLNDLLEIYNAKMKKVTAQYQIEYKNLIRLLQNAQ